MQRIGDTVKRLILAFVSALPAGQFLFENSELARYVQQKYGTFWDNDAKVDGRWKWP